MENNKILPPNSFSPSSILSSTQVEIILAQMQFWVESKAINVIFYLQTPVQRNGGNTEQIMSLMPENLPTSRLKTRYTQGAVL